MRNLGVLAQALTARSGRLTLRDTRPRGEREVQVSRRPANALLSAWMDLYGYTNSSLARAVRQRAVDGHKRHDIAPDARRVHAWRDDGETPRDPVPQLLCEIFTAHAGRPVAPADLGLAPGGVEDLPRAPWVLPVAIQALSQLSRSDIMLGPLRDPSTLPHDILGGQDLLDAVQPWLTGRPTESTGGDRPQRVGMTDVERIRAVTAALRTLDNRSGGALAREAVIGQLTAVVRLLDDSSYTEEVGRALLSAAGDLATVAGWTSHDIGMHTHAQYYLLLALRAAKEAGDRSLGAHALNCLARQANHLGRPADALDLVQLALYGARDNATPTMTAMLHALEARGYASLGRLREFDRAAGLAEDDFAHAAPEDDPPWVAFFDGAECYATLGVCHLIAAKHRQKHAEQAVALLSQASGRRSAERVRSTAFDQIGLARAYLQLGRLDEAVGSADTALRLLPRVTSTRVRDRLAELRAETAPFAGEPVIVELQERIA